eukprot:SAG31_NODE_1005_length_10432_cov_16.909909_6_plen_179_part_00
MRTEFKFSNTKFNSTSPSHPASGAIQRHRTIRAARRMRGDAGQAASAPQMSADQRCGCIHAVVAVLPSCYYGIAADSPCSVARVVAFASGIRRHPAPSDHQGGPSHAWRRWPGRLSASDERGPALRLHTCRGSSTRSTPRATPRHAPRPTPHAPRPTPHAPRPTPPHGIAANQNFNSE